MADRFIKRAVFAPSAAALMLAFGLTTSSAMGAGLVTENFNDNPGDGCGPDDELD